MDKMLRIHEVSKILGVGIKTLKTCGNKGELKSAMSTPGGRKLKQTIKELEKERQGENIENNSKSNID